MINLIQGELIAMELIPGVYETLISAAIEKKLTALLPIHIL